MIGGALSQRLAGLRCPDCGTVQSIYTDAGTKSRIRRPHDIQACPQCGTPLGMAHVPGGALREGLGWGLACAFLLGGAILLARAEGTPEGAALWGVVAVGAVALYVFALVATGLILGRTRRMVKS